MSEMILELHNELITKEQEINRLKDILREVREYCRNDDNFQIVAVEPYAQSMVKGIQRKLLKLLDKE